ncbi:MAG TPA: glucan ABC transporter ATP-binding protein/ permease [Xanthobacteraceae bacterium]|nr:glucan ABC transporter ATP-binding protein/ permease [Xanthobacteraceae bacterium]
MSFIRLYARVFLLLGPEAKLGVFLAGANILLAIAQFAEPVLFGRIVDALVRAQTGGRTPQMADLVPLLGAWVAFGLFSIASGVTLALHADRLAHRRRLAIITSYFEHVLHLPLAYHGGTHSGRLMKVMLQGADALWGLWLSFFRDHCAAFVALIALLPVTIWMNWRLGLLLVALLVVFAAVISYVMRQTETMQSGVERHQSDLAERASDAFGNIALIQSFARVDAEVVGLKDVASRVLAAQIPVLSWWAIVAVATRAATTLTILAIFIVGTWLYIHDLTTVGEIVTFVGIAGLFVGKLELTMAFTNRLLLDAPRLKDFMEVLDAAPSVRDRPGAIDIGRVRGEVEFDDVSLSYDGKRAAVADLSFKVAPGETVAVVGATGAGKSTALSLLHRSFDPQSGVVKVDGHDVRDVKLVSLRHNIGVVFQEALLFNRSIEENLRIGKPDATPEEIAAAISRAQADEFIARTPGGLAANVGERGRSLSGGERQRITIARVLLKDPPILILDEATSALDASTEGKVQAAIEEVMKGRTTFVIAHRLATVRNADRILVFHEGHIVETGNFDELVRQNGRFAALARAQFMVRDEPVPAMPAAQ